MEIGVNAMNVLAEFMPGLDHMDLVELTPTHSASMWIKEPQPHRALHWANGFGGELSAIQELVKAGLATMDESYIPTVELTDAGAALWVEKFADAWPTA